MISGIVLAAGASARMGRPKQLLELGGKPILQLVVDAAADSRLDDVIIVLGHEGAAIRSALTIPAGARTVMNPDYMSGQASSLQAGLAAVTDKCEAIVVLLGDQPHMTPGLIDRVIEEWRTDGPEIVRAMFGRTPGHPVLIARSGFDLVHSARGDEGLRSALDANMPQKESLPGGRGTVRELQLGNDPLADIDTQEEYERLRDG